MRSKWLQPPRSSWRPVWVLLVHLVKCGHTKPRKTGQYWLVWCRMLVKSACSPLVPVVFIQSGSVSSRRTFEHHVSVYYFRLDGKTGLEKAPVDSSIRPAKPSSKICTYRSRNKDELVWLCVLREFVWLHSNTKALIKWIFGRDWCQDWMSWWMCIVYKCCTNDNGCYWYAKWFDCKCKTPPWKWRLGDCMLYKLIAESGTTAKSCPYQHTYPLSGGKVQWNQ